MGRLAEHARCDASNVTGLVDRLESRGLVRRRPSAEDRRVKVLDLTPAGARLRAQLLRRMTTGARPLSRLSRRQQRTLVKILEVLVDESSTRAVTRRAGIGFGEAHRISFVWTLERHARLAGAHGRGRVDAVV